MSDKKTESNKNENTENAEDVKKPAQETIDKAAASETDNAIDAPKVMKRPKSLKMGGSKDNAKETAKQSANEGEPEGSPSPASDPQQNQPGQGSMNEEKAWHGMRQNWVKEQIEKAEAHALSFFEAADDDLPLAKHILLLSVAAFFVLFVIWANMATLDEVARGGGKIIPSSEVQAMQTLEPGIVEEFLVAEGDEVEKGQVLMRLSDIQASSDLGANRARYLGILASISRLQAEAEGKETVEFPDEVVEGAPSSVTEEMNTFRANKQQLQGQLNVLNQQLSQRQQEVRELETRIADTQREMNLQQQEINMIEPLVARGSAPRLELLQLKRTLQEKRSQLNSYSSNLPRAKSAAQEVRARIAEAKSTMQAQAQTELAAKLAEANEIKERLSAFKDRKTRTELRSPVNGTIKEITINTVGGVVRPGNNIIEIVPKDDQLLVEARIKPSDRAFIYAGQPAVVKITAYDYSIYGGLKAEVINISADTIQDEQGNSFYRVRLRTIENELKRKNEVLPIIPGMVTSVDILTGEKTVMQYLLKPFIKTLDNAMNER